MPALAQHSAAQFTLEQLVRRWPWQLSPHTLVSAGAPSEVHALGAEAYALINPTDPLRLALRLLHVAPPARRRGLARRLLASVQALHPQAEWSVPPTMPEEFSPEALAALVFREAGLHQLEMERPLEP